MEIETVSAATSQSEEKKREVPVLEPPKPITENPSPKQNEPHLAEPAKNVPQTIAEHPTQGKSGRRYDMLCKSVLEHAIQYSGTDDISEIEDDLTDAAKKEKIHVRAIPQEEFLTHGLMGGMMGGVGGYRTEKIQPEDFGKYRFCLRLSSTRPTLDYLFLGIDFAIVEGRGNYAPVKYLNPQFIRSEIEELWPPKTTI
jgi:hypothetical protein